MEILDADMIPKTLHGYPMSQIGFGSCVVGIISDAAPFPAISDEWAPGPTISDDGVSLV